MRNWTTTLQKGTRHDSTAATTLIMPVLTRRQEWLVCCVHALESKDDLLPPCFSLGRMMDDVRNRKQQQHWSFTNKPHTHNHHHHHHSLPDRTAGCVRFHSPLGAAHLLVAFAPPPSAPSLPPCLSSFPSARTRWTSYQKKRQWAQWKPGSRSCSSASL